MITSKFPMPWPPGTYAGSDEYAEVYRGASAWLKIDQTTGQINMDESFQIELPPYTQDLADAGKLVSDGWAFFGSFNTELSVGADFDEETGLPIGEPMEAGASKNNFDFLHVINWRAAEQLIADGKYDMIGGQRRLRKASST